VVLVGAVESVDAPGLAEFATPPTCEVEPVPPVVWADDAPARVVA